MSEGTKIRRLRLVREAGESRLQGDVAMRRYRLARLEEIAEATPPEGARGAAARGTPERERRAS